MPSSPAPRRPRGTPGRARARGRRAARRRAAARPRSSSLRCASGKLAQVVAPRREAVEEHGRAPGTRAIAARDVARLGESHARLQPLEARPARSSSATISPSSRNAVDRQARERRRDLRIARRDVLAAPADAASPSSSRALGEHAHAVVLDLEAASPGPRAGARPSVASISGRPRRRDRPGGAPSAASRVAQRRGIVPGVAHLLDREPGDHRLRIAVDRPPASPAPPPAFLSRSHSLSLLAAHAHQRPAAAQLEAEELELDLAALVLLERDPRA